MFKYFFILISIITFSHLGHSFPETARHGYLSCSTCHYSPSGRGLLTPYGKTLSNELYSYWKSENKNDSLESETPWWRVGGQVRLMQLIQNSKTLEKGRFFPMQAELEGAIDKESWALVASLGAWRPMESEYKDLKPYFRKHYLLYRPNENWVLRTGHFRISHGLGLPDHITLANQALGWTHSHETYNIELSYLDENNVFQGSVIAPSELLVTKEILKGGSLSLERLFQSNSKLGLNLSSFVRNKIPETQINLHSVNSISEKSFLQAELAFRTIQSLQPQTQWALFTRYSYQMAFAIRPFIQWEQAQLNESLNLKAERFYIGTEWFPVNSFDLFILAGQETQKSSNPIQTFTAIGHYYF